MDACETEAMGKAGPINECVLNCASRLGLMPNLESGGGMSRMRLLSLLTRSSAAFPALSSHTATLDFACGALRQYSGCRQRSDMLRANMRTRTDTVLNG